MLTSEDGKGIRGRCTVGRGTSSVRQERGGEGPSREWGLEVFEPKNGNKCTGVPSGGTGRVDSRGGRGGMGII